MEAFVFLAGIGTGILLALWAGHLARKKASREQREIAALAEAMTLTIFDVQDATAMGIPPGNCERLRDARNRAAAAYYAALKGE